MSYIDPCIHHRGVSTLRDYNLETLRVFAATDHLVVIREHDEPLAVLVPYDLYQRMQADVRILNEQRELSAALARLGAACGNAPFAE